MKKIKLSIMFNIIIVIYTIFASIIMFNGLKFMSDSLSLQDTNLSMFRFFTVDSNVFMGLVSLVFAVYEICLLRGKIKEIPKFMSAIKLMATAGVTLTFVVVFGYLGLMTGYGAMVQNSNLFFHLLTPILSIYTFVFLEENDLRLRTSLLGAVPTFLYEIYYVSNIIVHMENHSVSPLYDWYYFAQGGTLQMIIVAPGMIIISAILSAILLKGNRVFNK